MRKYILRGLFILCLSLQAVLSSAQSVGLLYGMSNSGSFFNYDPLTNKYAVPVIFSGPNGANPYGSLVQATNGRLYGMTSAGGSNSTGVLFYYDIISGEDSVVFSFTGPNGSNPYGTLMQATNGLLYGMTQLGGTWNDGVVFCFNPISEKDSVIFSFNDTNGMNPQGSLYQAVDGKLYGMTQYGGSNNDGVIFSIDPITGKDSVLVNFNGTNGAIPYYSNLIQNTDGVLYGMTYGGGLGTGVLFSYNPITGKDTVLIQFVSSLGAFPYGSLTHDTNGVLYGMTYNGGANGDGVLFSYNPFTFKDSILINFNFSGNGGFPDGTPIIASNGVLYATATQGGANMEGVMFSFNLSTSKDSVLFSFDNLNIYAYPYGALIETMGIYFTGLDSVNCFGDSGGWAKINIRGAKLPVSYLWSTGATIDSIGDLKAGTYSCKVTDARGITLTGSIKIIQPSQLILSSSMSNVCFGDSNGIASVIVSGGNPPYKYKWNKGATTDSIFNLKPGKDSCIVTDAKGCTASIVDIITQAAPFKIDSIVTTPASCIGCTDGTVKIYVSGGIPIGDSAIPGYPYVYSWTPGGDSITYRDTLTIRGLSTGGLIINVSNACGLAEDSTVVPLGIPLIYSINDGLSIYPVPSKGPVSIAMQGKGFELITISDELGNEVYKNALEPDRNNYIMHLDLSTKPGGIYIVQIITTKGIITRKLVIQK
ncbi:MAG TPA: choice-of-anchor tandem repeat GloVer-containing protein [Bacteroidia bacterium]|jgi:uncharacterized repeat protein (TIGR03803 family)|nr:choice-of-anchor tandem repeat GloVer-containing protein [Bacteroidia bacterium]